MFPYERCMMEWNVKSYEFKKIKLGFQGHFPVAVICFPMRKCLQVVHSLMPFGIGS